MSPSITVSKGGDESPISLSQLHQITGAHYLAGLEFIDFKTWRQIAKKTDPSEMDAEHKWLSTYFRKEVLQPSVLEVSLRWIDDRVGWGVFAGRDFLPTEFIAEYSGVVRKRVPQDAKNGYCFEYPLAPGRDSPYLIDAQDRGGISRYINHSNKPNLTSLSVHVEGVNHIVLYTVKKIGQGEQLCYDYGPDYWKRRGAPQNL
jgi:hypothetical protein